MDTCPSNVYILDDKVDRLYNGINFKNDNYNYFIITC
jgi:hypothetical protein